MNSVIRRLEELSMNGMPALTSNFYDGWILRFSNGYTKRGNSIHALYEGEKDVFAKIEYCESTYRGKNLPVIFKLTSDKEHMKLDNILEGSGYIREKDVSLQVLELTNNKKVSNIDLINISYVLTEEWLNNYTLYNNLIEKKDIIKEVLNRIVGQAVYVTIKENEDVVAVALGVIEDGFLGIFDVIVKENERKRGFGKDLISVLLNEGIKFGARMAYLQVIIDNKEALGMYSKFGFEELYKYWYRIK